MAKFETEAVPASADTRARAIEAAIACLAESGYAQTTIQTIARRAGMSHGPLQYHFAGKLDLMAEAAKSLQARRIAFFSKPAPVEANAIARDIVRLQAYCETPDFLATLELQVAARGDAALNRAIEAATGRHQMLVDEMLAKIRQSRGERLAGRNVAINDLLRALAIGLAVNRGAGFTPARVRAVWRLVQDVLA